MNDIRVKIVESPRNPAGDLPALATDGSHHNEVDPLAFDETDIKDPVVPAIRQERLEIDDKKNGCENPAKEQREDVHIALEQAKVLNAQCEKIKEELLKDDTSSLDSSIEDIAKADESNHVQPTAETPMETEDSHSEKPFDPPIVETAEKPLVTLENDTTEQHTKVEQNDKAPSLDEQVTRDVGNKPPSPVPEVVTAKDVIANKEAIVPKEVPEKESTVKELVKEVLAADTVSLPKEVIEHKVPLVKEVQPQVDSIKETSPSKETPKIQEQVIKIPKVTQDKEIIKVQELIRQKEESKPNEISPVTTAAPKQKEPIKEKSPIREVITLPAKAPSAKDQVETEVPIQQSPVTEKVVDVEMIEVAKNTQVDVKNEKTIETAKPEVKPVNGDIAKDEQPAKRRASEEAETDSPLKKLCQEVEKMFPAHDSMINEFIQTTTKHNLDEIQRHTEQLLSEIQTLRELAQKKEHEWNNILHLKKVKEEILLRLLRRKQVLAFEKSTDVQNGPSCKDPFDYLNQTKNLAIDKSDEISGLVLKQPTPPATLNNNPPIIQPPAMPAPVTTHYNPLSGLPPPYDKAAHMQSMSKPVFPQSLMMPGPTMPFPRDMNGQLNFGLPMGRQGPTKDVKSIIADYRQRNPDVTPRRGRRMKTMINPNMMNQPRQIAPKVENLNNLGMIFNNLDMNQKAMLERLSQMQATSLPNGMSFKDVLVQYANIQQQSAGLVPPATTARPEAMLHCRPEPHQSRPEPTRRRERPQTQTQAQSQAQTQAQTQAQAQLSQHEEVHISVKQNERLAASSPRLPPPPPYPEISLLPVSSAQDPPQQTSLLHGILTKQASPAPQSYSPTLAKLLTSPERAQSAATLPAFGQAKNCGEITITPVQPTPPPDAQPEKTEEVVQLDEDESPQSEGSTEGSPEGAGGRLVIDEGSANPEPADAPLCQGCRRRDAQFVCAGCGNQWYCSRDCQVAAWDEHSELCSG